VKFELKLKSKLHNLIESEIRIIISLAGFAEATVSDSVMG